jgi:Gly-Xaa carboxypeptidase
MHLQSLNYTLLSQSEVESPDEFRSRKRSNNVRRGLLWGFVGLLASGILIGIVVGLTRPKDDYDLGNEPVCPQYSPIKARSETRAKFERDLMSDLSTDDFFDASVKRLQGAVQIPTESYDDMKLVGDDPRWDIFVDFHHYLEKTFPLV